MEERRYCSNSTAQWGSPHVSSRNSKIVESDLSKVRNNVLPGGHRFLLLLQLFRAVIFPSSGNSLERRRSELERFEGKTRTGSKKSEEKPPSIRLKTCCVEKNSLDLSSRFIFRGCEFAFKIKGNEGVTVFRKYIFKSWSAFKLLFDSFFFFLFFFLFDVDLPSKVLQITFKDFA